MLDVKLLILKTEELIIHWFGFALCGLKKGI